MMKEIKMNFLDPYSMVYNIKNINEDLTKSFLDFSIDVQEQVYKNGYFDKVDFSELNHRLSEYLFKKEMKKTHRTRNSFYEWEVGKKIDVHDVLKMLIDKKNISNIFDNYKGIFDLPFVMVRNSNCGISNFKMKTNLMFSCPFKIENQLKILISFYLDRNIKCSFSKALAFWISFLSIHPLEDGNGRLSRIFFHSMCYNTISKYFFIPINEIDFLSNRSILISLREASLNKELSHLIYIFHKYVDINQQQNLRI